MKQITIFLLAILFFNCSGTSSGPSQTDASLQSSFEATTALGPEIRKILGIVADDKHDMMKWDLTLNEDPKNLSPTDFKLIYEYGIPKQGTRGFMEGSKKIELNGKWTIEKGTAINKEAVVIKLTASGSPVSLLFLQVDENILHLLNDNKNLIVGNGAWSYSLNKKDPIMQNRNIQLFNLPQQISGNIDTVGMFEGRTPCSVELRDINNISSNGCNLIKCQLILLQDVNTHTPTTFILKTIYVGKGDTRYITTGKWKMMKRTENDIMSIVYQLEPDSSKSTAPLLFLKGDDNILFFMDRDGNFLVGNDYCSYTLNRAN